MVPETKCVTYFLVAAEIPVQYVGGAYLPETEMREMMFKWWPEQSPAQTPRNTQLLPENLTVFWQSELSCTSNSHEKQRNLNRLALGLLYCFLKH